MNHYHWETAYGYKGSVWANNPEKATSYVKEKFHCSVNKLQLVKENACIGSNVTVAATNYLINKEATS